jgi:putative protease
LSGPLAVGDTIHIQGHTTDLEEKITSMQVDGQEVTEAGSGDSVGIKVSDRARVGDQVFKVA